MWLTLGVAQLRVSPSKVNSSMRITVRPAVLEAERDLLIQALFRYLTPLSDARRFDWLYRNNPHGSAQAWIATEAGNSNVVGVAAAFPRRVVVGGEEKLGYVLGDFCINASYRSLGPALQLQRACLADLASGHLAFWYDFPSESMMAVYGRLEIKPRGRMVRFAKPLRADRKIRELVKVQRVARALSKCANVALALRDGHAGDFSEWMLAMHEGACGEDFTALAERVGAGYGVCVQRSAEYLNWRFLAHPHRRHEILTARANGALLAYAIFTQDGEDATLVDLFGVEDPAMLTSLLVDVVAILRQRGVITLSAPLFASHPWVGLFQRLGFRPRESSPVVYTLVHPTAGHDSTCSKWFFMAGDRDS